MRLQLSLEFMIVFSFVLIIFLFLFAMISSERNTVLGDQTFSQLQLQAQNIASAIDSAVQSGNGYAGSIPVASLIGIIQYNVTITKNGMVILQAKVGKQIIRATAYSMAQNIVSNPSFLLGGTTNQYILPIANGSISLENLFGTICVDYSCPATSGEAKSILLSSQNTYAANFNGQNTYISAGKPIVSNTISGLTISSWVYLYSLTPPPSGAEQIAGEGGCNEAGVAALNVNYAGDGSGSVQFGCTGYGRSIAPSGTLTTGRWYNIIGVYNKTTGLAYIYVNGAEVGTITSIGLGSSSSAFTIGGVGTVDQFNGMITNVQIYDEAIQQSQAQQLYQEGIAGLPISNAGLVGWYPLNGNANDYSGLGNNCQTYGPIFYKSVSELFAKVFDNQGSPLINTIVNFESPYEILSPATNYTNQEGIAVSYINTTTTTGKTLVRATAFNGGISTQNYYLNLLEWLPLDARAGNIALHSISKNVFWNAPEYYAYFDGSSYVNLPQGAPAASSSLTASLWFRTTSSGVMLWNGNNQLGNATCYSPIMYITPQGYLAGGDSPSTGTPVFITNYFVADGKWHFVAINQTTTQETLFLDGTEIGSVTVTPQTCTPFNWTIGAERATGRTTYFNGSVANVQLYSTSLSIPQIRQLYREGIAGLPISNAGLVGWWPLDGDANDYSGNNYTGTIYGDLHFLDQTKGEASNYSSMLVGSFKPNGAITPDAYINIPGIVPINYSSFSYFAWIKPTYIENYGRVLTTSWGDSGTIEIAAGGSTQIMIDGYNTGGWLGINSHFPLNTWNLVGATYNGSNYTVYLNGKHVWTKNVGKLVGNAYPGNLQIGLTSVYSSQGNQYFGDIANAQFYGTNLSSSQVQQLYQEGVAGLPISNAGLVGWWPLDGNANDYSGNGNNGVIYNVTFVPNSISKRVLVNSFGGSGVEFNGNSYIYNSSVAPLDNHYAFTIAAEIYLNSNTKTQFIYTEGNPCIDFGFGVNSSGYLFAQIFNSGLTNNWMSFNTNLKVPLNSWTFVAFTLKNGAIGRGSGTIYMNSQSQNFTIQEEGSNANYFGVGFNTGYLCGQSMSGLNGSIANLQLYGSALTPQQINSLYNNMYLPSAIRKISMGVLP
ncbi:MAG: LamG-like jellyroll fold domain-containing protein [Candidatus Micrarchaeia archaeon]